VPAYQKQRAKIPARWFCVITLAGSSDVQLLTPKATVTLPVLNYDMGFGPFLIVGPIVLISLTIYLHVFVAHHRMHKLASEARQPTLPNLSSLTARMLVVAVFYWMVPLTLVAFAFKALPRPIELPLALIAMAVTATLVILQIRRCPPAWRAWAVPLIPAIFILFYAGVFRVAEVRHLNLFKADLSGEDLRKNNLSGAFISEANLSQTNLSGADLSGADLSGANLSQANVRKANLSGAILSGVDLSQFDLSEANLSRANLSEASLRKAKLSRAILSGAILSGVDLSQFDLSRARLSGADLSETNLSGANLNGADLSEANLSRADLSEASLRKAKLSRAILSGAILSGVDLSGAILSGVDLVGFDLSQSMLDTACGDEATKLGDGLAIENCTALPL